MAGRTADGALRGGVEAAIGAGLVAERRLFG